MDEGKQNCPDQAGIGIAEEPAKPLCLMGKFERPSPIQWLKVSQSGAISDLDSNLCPMILIYRLKSLLTPWPLSGNKTPLASLPSASTANSSRTAVAPKSGQNL